MERPVAISTRGLTKRYGRILALDGMDLDVPAGSITGLLGASGSGRTTVLRLLAGLLRPSSGGATVAGVDITGRRRGDLRRRVGLMPATDAIYGWMSGREQLGFAAELSGIARTEIADRVELMLERVGLEVLADTRTAVYDLAERRRLGLAQAVVGDPEVVLLDEPVSSLDASTRAELLAVIRDLGTRATVLLSSGEPAHVEAACDHVAVLEGGRLVLAAEVDALVSGVTSRTYRITLDRQPGLALAGLIARLQGEPWVRTVEVDLPELRVSVVDDARATRELLASIVATGVPLTAFRREQPTLAGAIGERTGRAPMGAGSRS